jgi:hypothetical protein
MGENGSIFGAVMTGEDDKFKVMQFWAAIFRCFF